MPVRLPVRSRATQVRPVANECNYSRQREAVTNPVALTLLIVQS